MNINFLERLPKSISIFGLQITFYALVILAGALIALFLGSFEARKKGFSWDFFATIFLIAFPSGIIGARIWYVIAEWTSGGFSQNFAEVFYIWDGGLAIQGGAIGGILAGALVILFRRKGADLRQVLDFAVPGILVAQAIGRWGNFFNFEVYGLEVSREAWNFLPNFILNQMQVKLNNPALINAPLFLTEGIVNMVGYLLMSHFLIPFLQDKKLHANGDGFCYYFIWYGITRAIMEPMRNSTFIMGNQTQASTIMAFVFIGSGVIALLLNHLLPNLFKKQKDGKLA